MTSENAPGAGTPAGGAAPAGDRPGAADDRPAPPRHTRRPDLDWDAEPGRGADPEDSRRGRDDNLARLLDDVPPHHVEHS
jgi:hypothetical protein